MKRLIIQLSMTVFVAAIAAIALGLFIPKPQSTERGSVRGLLKGQKGAPLNLG